MRQNHRFGFTFIETLLGVVLMIIVIGGITTGLVSSIRVFERAVAQAKLVDGMRFTMESFNKQISPKLNKTSYVEILNTKLNHLPKQSELLNDQRCLFLSGDSLVLRSPVQDTILPGSEYIKYVHFKALSLDESDGKDKSGDNYGLTMDLYASVDYTSSQVAHYSTTTFQALYNKPVRSTDNYIANAGAGHEGSMEGDVLVYVAVDDHDYNIVFDNLHLYQDGTTNLIDKQDKANSGVIARASYDLYDANATASNTLTDASTYRWYITLSSDLASDLISDGDPREEVYGGGTEASYSYWLLTDKSGKPIQTVTWDSSGPDHDGKYYVSTDSTNKEWLSISGKSYGSVVCRITPALKKFDGTIVQQSTPPVLAAKFTPYVNITTSGSNASGGYKLWQYWSAGIKNQDSPSTYFRTTRASNVASIFENEEGKSITIGQDTNSSLKSHSSTAALLSADVLDEETKNTVETDDRSYTTITNYSVIVDAYIDNDNGGYGILLSGMGTIQLPGLWEKETTFNESGYMLQYDRYVDGFPLRVFKNGEYLHDYNQDFNYVYGINKNSLTVGKYTANSSDNSVGKNEFAYFTQMGDFTSMNQHIYKIGYLKNDILSCDSYIQYDKNSNQAYKPGNMLMQGRQRFMISVLEYYDNGAPERPKYIIRARLLKNNSEVPYSLTIEKNDPWHIGPAFYKSEPMWFGSFVGDSPDILSNQTYSYTVKNYSTIYSGKKIYFNYNDDNIKPGETNSHYVTNGFRETIGSDKYKYVTVFDGKTLDFATDVDEVPNNSYDVAHKRYLGIRLWGKDATSVKIFSINHAPGFRKSELLAIMPTGAQFYEVDDTGQTSPDPDHQKDLNKGLFKSSSGYSDGRGGGVMSLQHVPGSNCKCPWCTYYKDN